MSAPPISKPIPDIEDQHYLDDSEYNMLARISDNYKMIDHWNYWETKESQFEGAWDPYVRDFDPTLNYYIKCFNAPKFEKLNQPSEIEKSLNKSVDMVSVESIRFEVRK